MILVSFDEWADWSAAGDYTVLPYVVKHTLAPDFRVLSWEKAWKSAGRHSFVLESGKSGRYTFLGLETESVIRGDLGAAVVMNSDGSEQQWNGTPLHLVKRWMAPYTSPRSDKLPKFIGGCVGFWGYDVIRTIERLPEHARRALPIPDYAFVRVNRLWIVDHEDNCLYCAVHMPLGEDQVTLDELYRRAGGEAKRMKRVWDDAMAADSSADKELAGRIELLRRDIAERRIQIDVESIPGLHTEFTREQYMQAVHRIQSYIRAGDVFQVNLSVRQSTKLDSPPSHIYEWLRHLNPSPYMGYLQYPDFQIVSGSPELLVQKNGSFLRTRPIAGTRPRGTSAEEDTLLADELLADEKERAEHIMLVDLERNDLGRIARFGTVKVDELMTVEYYSHVMHIVSEVSGELADDADVYDVIAAVFPGGTITGAPKIRTMEIIEELEPVRRGPYTGSIGWIDYNGDMEFNIVIRTLFAVGGEGHVQAGAGIVIDSDAGREYTESLNKAKALWKAIQYAALTAENSH